jgi:hypothetical protein
MWRLRQRMERFLIAWNHMIEKESLKFKVLEHGLIEKVGNFFGTCANGGRAFRGQPSRLLFLAV